MRALTLLILSSVFVACSQSDWERQQMSSDSPVSYVAKNDDGEGFAVREGLFVASTDKLASILDSGTSYPFELYLSGDGYVTIYKGKTPEWYNPHGILLIPDIETVFSGHPKLQDDFVTSEKIVVVIMNDISGESVYKLECETKGAESVFK